MIKLNKKKDAKVKIFVNMELRFQATWVSKAEVLLVPSQK